MKTECSAKQNQQDDNGPPIVRRTNRNGLFGKRQKRHQSWPGAAHLRRKSRSRRVGAAIFKTCRLLATLSHSKRRLMNAAHVRHPVALQSTVRFHTSLRASCSGNQIAGCWKATGMCSDCAFTPTLSRLWLCRCQSGPAAPTAAVQKAFKPGTRECATYICM